MCQQHFPAPLNVYGSGAQPAAARYRTTPNKMKVLASLSLTAVLAPRSGFSVLARARCN